MVEPTTTIQLTEQQRAAVVGALYDKLSDTDRYLISYAHDGDEPGELDSCCNGHLQRYRQRRSQRDALREQRDQTLGLLRMVEGAELSSWCNSVPRALADALTDREDAASCHAAEWLAEHENDDELWNVIGGLMDRITEMAGPHEPQQ